MQSRFGKFSQLTYEKNNLKQAIKRMEENEAKLKPE
jgi:hypothetical protein